MQFRHHHVSLSVANMQDSVAFYSHFGCDKLFDQYLSDKQCQLVHLKLNNVFIELFCFDQRIVADQSQDLLEDLKRGGIRHFALQVDDINAAKIWAETQLSQSVKIVQASSSPNIRYFFLRDPDGNFIEIIEDKRFDAA